MTFTYANNTAKNIPNSSFFKKDLAIANNRALFLEILKANCPFGDEQQKQIYLNYYATYLFDLSRDSELFSQRQIFLLVQTIIASVKQEIRIKGVCPIAEGKLFFVLQLDIRDYSVISLSKNRYDIELFDSFDQPPTPYSLDECYIEEARYDITFDGLNQYFRELKQRRIQFKIAKGERSVHMPLPSNLILSLEEFRQKREQNPNRSPQMVELEQEFEGLVLKLMRQTTLQINFEVCYSLFSYHQLKILIPLIKSAITYHVRICDIVGVGELAVELQTFHQKVKVIHNDELDLYEIELVDGINNITHLKDVHINDFPKVMELMSSQN